MPEGDTLFRTAATLHRWLAGRQLTAATTRVAGFPATKLVGQTVDAVEAQGKHLLIRLDTGQVLHSHMKMTGSWHVYREGERWRKPPSQARLVLTAGDRVAVCFNAPVVELLQPRAEAAHPGLRALGPDLLAAPVDYEESRRRARARPTDTALGDLLLDQRVAAGLGNIWRCESLFVERLSPWKAVGDVTDDQLDQLYRTGARLLAAQVGVARPDFRRWVYDRAGHACHRCGTAIQSRQQRVGGDLARTAYWCPSCQP